MTDYKRCDVCGGNTDDCGGRHCATCAHGKEGTMEDHAATGRGEVSADGRVWVCANRRIGPLSCRIHGHNSWESWEERSCLACRHGHVSTLDGVLRCFAQGADVREACKAHKRSAWEPKERKVAAPVQEEQPFATEPDVTADEPVADVAVHHPAHYNAGKFEVIAVIDDWNLGFCLGNVVKYVARAEHKNNALEDLKKARWYLDHEIEKREKR